MPEREAPKPLLMNELNLPDKINLGQTTLTPGYQVILRLIENLCSIAVQEAIKADPEDPNYKHILEARHQFARAVNKASTLLIKSIDYHVQFGIAEEEQQQVDALLASQAE